MKNSLNTRGLVALRVLVMTLVIPLSTLAQQKPMRLWFSAPAYQPAVFSYQAPEFQNSFSFNPKGWMEALPVGNGRIGAMVFGGVNRERIQLNEETLWDGYRYDSDNPGAAKALPEVQRLMFAGDNDAAEALAEKTMMGIPVNIKPYQSLGDLMIERSGTDTVYTSYRRWLSLDSAVAVTQFSQGGVRYRREVFASHPAQILVVRFTADKPGSINLKFRMMREKDAHVTASADGLTMRGRIDRPNEQTGQPEGMRFVSYLRSKATGGRTIAGGDSSLIVENADELLLYLSAATDYTGQDPDRYCQQTLDRALAQPYDRLWQEHLRDYRALYDRVKIKLTDESNPDELPQNERLNRVIKDDFEDPYLSELLFQYGRYLLIASSRPGDLPANLQGLWNQSIRPPWSSDYHVNINLQMNYMAAEAANLAECHEPLFDLMDSLAIHGARTARATYNARGWVVHHLTDVFWRTSPVDGVVGVWPMGSGWLAHHLYEHYQFSSNKEFLKKRAFPLMKGAAEFYLDFLKPIPAGLPMAGKLVTNPSHSPENAFEKADGTQYQFTYGAAMDMQICRELFTNCLRAIDDLSTPAQPFEPDFRREIESALAQLAPTEISARTGGIQEWVEDYKETEIGHRHISHLYGLFPANEITVNTPVLYAAARRSLERRLMGNPKAAVEEAGNRYLSYGSYLDGKSFGGWQSVWISMMWLRLGEAQQAYRHHQYQLKYNMNPNFFGGAYQLDGTFGSTAVVAEMLLQSHTGTIHLLPALPERWAEGSVQGLRARGGVEIVTMNWQKGRLVSATLRADNDGSFRLRVADGQKVKVKGRGARSRFMPESDVVFNARAGQLYHLKVR